MNILLKVLGCRGSIPRSGKEFENYGGATSSYAIRIGERLVVLDAGTGILSVGNMLRKDEKELTLLFSHTHADHILGLPMCSPAFSKDFTFHVYGKTRGGQTVKDQIDAFLEAPTWPVNTDKLPATFIYAPLEDGMVLPGDPEIKLNIMEAVHPNGCSLIKLQALGKTIVYATDCTITPENRDEMAAFAGRADLLLIDGQYTPVELGGKAGFGHNSWTDAAEFGQFCKARRTLIVHHDPFHKDVDMDRAAEDVYYIDPSINIAYEGEEIEL